MTRRRPPLITIAATTARLWGVVFVLDYASVIVLVMVILAMEDDDFYRNVAPAIPRILPSLVALATFTWGLMVWNTWLAWAARVVGWLMLALSAGYPFISFSFVLMPLALSALPALWPWQVRLRSPDPC